MIKDRPEWLDNCEKAFDSIVNFQQSWDQGVWREITNETACGTALCFAGWGVANTNLRPLVSPGEDPDGDTDLFYIPKSNPLYSKAEPEGRFKVMSVPDIAAHLFDIYGHGPNQGVFSANNSLADIRRYIDDARKASGLGERNFAKEPVQVQSLRGISAEDRAAIRKLVKDFNARAIQGHIWVDVGPEALLKRN
jgi:hypothetical protein